MKAQIEEIDERGGWFITGRKGIIDGPFETDEEAARMADCPECGERIEDDGFCRMCSLASADFEDRAYGPPDTDYYAERPFWTP